MAKTDIVKCVPISTVSQIGMSMAKGVLCKCENAAGNTVCVYFDINDYYSYIDGSSLIRVGVIGASGGITANN